LKNPAIHVSSFVFEKIISTIIFVALVFCIVWGITKDCSIPGNYTVKQENVIIPGIKIIPGKTI